MERKERKREHEREREREREIRESYSTAIHTFR